MNEILFIFGRTPDLSWQELQSFYPGAVRVIPDIALVKKSTLNQNWDATASLAGLGGTVKIAETLCETGEPSEEQLADLIIRESPREKIEFGLSLYGVETKVKLPLSAIKNRLAMRGITARYHEVRHGSTLSSVVVNKKHLLELVLVKTKEHWLIGKTLAVQDFEAWNQRDWGRPYADPKSGMLPPKVARMVANIAKPDLLSPDALSQLTLLDPFCGMGTILAEALLVGWQVIGSDQAETAVFKAQKNLAWLASIRREVKADKYRLINCEATHISKKIPPESIDAVVTEPYLGNSRIKSKIHPPPGEAKFEVKDLKNRIKGLEKLYLGCLRDWRKVLKAGGKVVIALPEYAIYGQKFFVKKVVDSCENLGYTILAGPLEYSRPQAVVRRQFYLFEKHDEHMIEKHDEHMTIMC